VIDAELMEADPSRVGESEFSSGGLSTLTEVEEDLSGRKASWASRPPLPAKIKPIVAMAISVAFLRAVGDRSPDAAERAPRGLGATEKGESFGNMTEQCTARAGRKVRITPCSATFFRLV